MYRMIVLKNESNNQNILKEKTNPGGILTRSVFSRSKSPLRTDQICRQTLIVIVIKLVASHHS